MTVWIWVGCAGFVSLVFLLVSAGFVLHRRLRRFEADARAFGEASLKLSEALTIADQRMAELKHQAGASAQQAQADLQKSRVLRDDLTFLHERGTELADRLENAIRSGRDARMDSSDFQVVQPSDSRANAQEALLAALREEVSR